MLNPPSNRAVCAILFALVLLGAGVVSGNGPPGDATPQQRPSPVAATCASAPPPGAITVSREDGELSLVTDYKGAQARLRAARDATASSPDVGLAFDVVQLKEKLPIAEQVPLLCALLARYFEIEPKAPSYRFTMDFYDEMKPRLIAATAASRDWDRRKGRPRTGLANDLIVKLMNQNKTYSEVNDVFTSFGFDISVAAVEKADTYVVSIKDLPKYGIHFSQPGLSATDRFPMKVMIDYYYLRPAQPGPGSSPRGNDGKD